MNKHYVEILFKNNLLPKHIEMEVKNLRKQEKRNWKLNNKITNIIKEHVKKNLKQYLIVALIFVIGILLGVIFINNININEQKEVSEYLNNFINALKTDYEIDLNVLLRTTIVNNLLLAVILWFIGSTVIGIPIVYAIICIRGFSLGYTIAVIIATLGTWKGIAFGLITLFSQNIIFIPCIFALAVSGMKLYKSIIKDKRKENVKTEIYRHTIFSGIMTVCLILSSFVEVYISSNLLMMLIKYL